MQPNLPFYVTMYLTESVDHMNIVYTYQEEI